MSEPKHHLPAFEQVIEEHGRAVLRFCAAQAGRQRAEDVFQETMLAALRAYDELRDSASIRPWLFAIAARKAVDAHRRGAREPDPVADLDPAAAAGEIALRDEGLWRRVRALPDKQRSAVGLRYVADLSHREIAEVMGISEAAARRNVFEGLEQLRRQASATDLTKA